MSQSKSAVKILDLADVDWNKLQLKGVNKNVGPSGAAMWYGNLLYDGRRNFEFMLTDVRMTGPIKRAQKDESKDSGKGKGKAKGKIVEDDEDIPKEFSYSLMVTFDGSPHKDVYTQKIDELEERIKRLFAENYTQFGGKKDKPIYTKRCHDGINPNTNEQYPPGIKGMKLFTEENQNGLRFKNFNIKNLDRLNDDDYNKGINPDNVNEEVPPGSEIGRVIIQLPSMFATAMNSGYYLYPKALRYRAPVQQDYDDILDEYDRAEASKTSANPTGTPATVPAPQAKQQAYEKEMEEDEEEEDVSDEE